jgi:hypothetical protein
MTEVIDQAAHFIVAWLTVVVLQWLDSSATAAGGGFVGFMLGLVREVTEEDEVSLKALGRALGSYRDLLFWTLGGVVGSLW